MDYNEENDESLASKLPPELLANIFSRLPHSDVKVCNILVIIFFGAFGCAIIL